MADNAIFVRLYAEVPDKASVDRAAVILNNSQFWIQERIATCLVTAICL